MSRRIEIADWRWAEKHPLTPRLTRYGRFLTYGYCPRGSGDLAEHRDRYLVHVVIPDGTDPETHESRSRFACMDVLLSHRLAESDLNGGSDG